MAELSSTTAAGRNQTRPQIDANTIKSNASLTAMLRGYDDATEALDTARALLSVLSASYDSTQGTFINHDRDIWLSILAVHGLVETASKAIELAPLPANAAAAAA